MLKHVSPHPLSRWSRDAKKIYREAFPAQERIPFLAIQLASLLPANRFWAHVDDGALVGISFHAVGHSAAFVLYLAVDEHIRSKGYGSRILAAIVDDCAGIPVGLNVEMPDEGASNAAQRVARVRFYERNGFRDADHVVRVGDDAYLVMTTAPEGGFDADAFNQAMAAITLGISVQRAEPRGELSEVQAGLRP